MKNKIIKNNLAKNNYCTYSNFHVRDGYVYACNEVVNKSHWDNIIKRFKKIVAIIF